MTIILIFIHLNAESLWSFRDIKANKILSIFSPIVTILIYKIYDLCSYKSYDPLMKEENIINHIFDNEDKLHHKRKINVKNIVIIIVITYIILSIIFNNSKITFPLPNLLNMNTNYPYKQFENHLERKAKILDINDDTSNDLYLSQYHLDNNEIIHTTTPSIIVNEDPQSIVEIIKNTKITHQDEEINKEKQIHYYNIFNNFKNIFGNIFIYIIYIHNLISAVLTFYTLLMVNNLCQNEQFTFCLCSIVIILISVFFNHHKVMILYSLNLLVILYYFNKNNGYNEKLKYQRRKKIKYILMEYIMEFIIDKYAIIDIQEKYSIMDPEKDEIEKE